MEIQCLQAPHKIASKQVYIENILAVRQQFELYCLVN